MDSSGTTRFPSMVFQSHESMLRLMKSPLDLCGEVVTAQSYLMYPCAVILMPSSTDILRFWITSLSVAAGAITAHFLPQLAVIPTSGRFISSLMKTKCIHIFSVPSFLRTTKFFNINGHTIPLLFRLLRTEVRGVSVTFAKSAPPEGWEWMRVGISSIFRCITWLVYMMGC
ncbi:uncharacterized protein BT62DRAFT_1033184 [Guyanagaster necrorhizus]|uniref:Uncharacterized protein n=1 Tax=Guyanagaster necrorhizus TaxID=856835 RepID=A0A9P7VNB3_9AGAR|nr:uncharacterized protein BT62DRAFT_1033184 [Guyanagaster necrorhizus MCA 3950]KAG7443710.1 hypothetical protein BT62DRAFT_1033184 [Guyanagaster necrorhizus MCA 3950]